MAYIYSSTEYKRILISNFQKVFISWFSLLDMRTAEHMWSETLKLASSTITCFLRGHEVHCIANWAIIHHFRIYCLQWVVEKDKISVQYQHQITSITRINFLTKHIFIGLKIEKKCDICFCFWYPKWIESGRLLCFVYVLYVLFHHNIHLFGPKFCVIME